MKERHNENSTFNLVLREEEEIGVAWHGAASVFIDYDPYTKARCIQESTFFIEFLLFLFIYL